MNFTEDILKLNPNQKASPQEQVDFEFNLDAFLEDLHSRLTLPEFIRNTAAPATSTEQEQD